MPLTPPSSLGGTPKGEQAEGGQNRPAPPPFNPNAPLSRRSFVASPAKFQAPTEKPKQEAAPARAAKAKPLPTGGPLLERPVSSPIPIDAYREFADIRSRHWPTSMEFLRRFKAHLLCYIGDGEAHGVLPIVHTCGVGGLSPATTAFPDPSMQDRGYAMYFSVNGFKDATRRNEANLYSLNAFYADIDWPDKKNPPTNEQLKAFKRAVHEDLVFCISNGRGAFVADPLRAEHCPPPTAIVETRNGFHVYWLFDRPVFAGDEGFSSALPEYKSVQSAIIERFQADPQCKDAARVLRVPGSFHLKDPANPFPVKLVYFEPDHVYSFEQGADFWLRNPNATRPSYAFHHAEEFRKKVQAHRVRVGSPHPAQSGPFKSANITEGITEEDVRKLDEAFPIEDRPSFRSIVSPVGIAEGSRNKSLLIAATLLRRAGKRESEVQERFAEGYNGLPAYEIRNTVRSAFAGERPYDFGWNDPVLAEHVTLEEAAKVRGIVKGIMESKRKRYAESKPGKKDGGAVAAVPESQGDRDAGLAGEGGGAVGTHAVVGDGGEAHQPDAGHVRVPAIDGSDGRPPVQEPADAAAPITIAGIAEIEKSYAILDKATQKRLYNVYDRLFLRYHPDIVSVDDVGFFRYDAGKRYYQPISEDGIRRIVSEDLASIGCLDHRGTSNVSAKVESLQAFREIRMSREEAEAVLFSDGRQGTVVNTLSGFVDLDSGTLLSDATRLFVTSVLPVRYDPAVKTTPEALEALCPRWLRFIREITASTIPGEAENKAMLLQEMAGYCFTPYTFFQTAFMLLGSGSNGKSTFLDAIIAIIGDEDTSTLNLEDISSQFRLSGLYRKRLNVVEEISNNYFESDNLKKIISGQEVTADRKYMQPIRFKPTAKLVFALNAFPRVNDQSHALYRRFKSIPFNVTFGEDAKDVSLPQKLWAERDGIFRWAMQGWQRLKLNGRFTHSVEAEQSSEEFKEHNSPLVEFLLRDCLVYEEAAERLSARMDPLRKDDFVVSVDALYVLYRAFAKENGYGVKSRQGFLKEMTSLTHSRLRHVGLSPTLRTVFVGIRPKKVMLPADAPNFH